MREFLLLALCCLASVTAEDEVTTANDTMLSSNERGMDGLVPLVLLEIHKTYGLLSPREGRDHNIVRVLLQEHPPLYNVSKWELQLKGEVYIYMDDDPYQTQLEFGAELTNADKIFVIAKTKGDLIVAALYASLDVKDMKSRVARVGGDYDPTVSSLRVATGALPEVKVGKELCRMERSPCYYLRTRLPQEVPRCVQITYTNINSSFVRHCDDTITSFREIPEKVMLNLEDDILTVKANFTTTPNKVEVVVFDAAEEEVLSPEDFGCELGEPRQLSHVCRQRVTGASDLPRFLVLVVGLDKEGFVLESRMDAYEVTVSTESNKGVIVGSVIGVLCAIALIAGIFVYVKGKKEKSSSSSTANRGSSKYERTATTEPPAQEEA